jgi:hypothetical protein
MKPQVLKAFKIINNDKCICSKDHEEDQNVGGWIAPRLIL